MSGSMKPIASSKANSTVRPSARRRCATLPSHLKPVSVCSNLKPSAAAIAPSAALLTADASMTQLLGSTCGGRCRGS